MFLLLHGRTKTSVGAKPASDWHGNRIRCSTFVWHGNSFFVQCLEFWVLRASFGHWRTVIKIKSVTGQSTNWLVDIMNEKKRWRARLQKKSARRMLMITFPCHAEGNTVLSGSQQNLRAAVGLQLRLVMTSREVKTRHTILLGVIFVTIHGVSLLGNQHGPVKQSRKPEPPEL